MPRMTRTKRTSVTFLITSLASGGAEKHTLQLFNSLDQARFSASLAYLKRMERLPSLPVTPGRSRGDVSGLANALKPITDVEPTEFGKLNGGTSSA